MIILHHCMSARSFRPLWMLEELGLPYKLKMHDFPPRLREKDYLQVNNLGTIPALTDGEVFMTESVAMCQYLAAVYSEKNLDVLSSDLGFSDYINYLHFGEATLTFPQTLILRYKYFEVEERRNIQVAEDYAKWFLSRLKSLEGKLSGKEFISADRFTAADISIGYALMLASHLGLSEKFKPEVSRYWKSLALREAYQRALLVQEKAAKEQGISAVPSPNIR
ncbi:glutathione S-transferase family protein [Vreelandella nanhaiensis]|uniref:Glutathione S-transferase n=1 Tax=Vreelandella nanhaiensis TaxID=1258546 RepID=A0A433KSR9_9GAMM|nr:glutathione S-transferase [Halomonas nanhaiensis]RUR32666.1 glutathione S-transferase [Halomonas nanhaiensis]